MGNRAIFIFGVIITVLVTIFTCILFILIKINSGNFAREFYSQNYRDIEGGDSFNLITQLNSLTNQDQILCIKGFQDGVQFFSSRTGCFNSIFSKTVEVKGVNRNISIQFEYRLSTPVLISLGIAFLALSLLSAIGILVLIYIQKMEGNFLRAYNSLALRVGHDIKSPLSALSILTSVSDLNSHEARELLKTSARRINLIAQDLVDRGRDPKNVNLKIQIVKLRDLILKITSEKKLEFKNEQFEFEVNLPSYEVSAWGNEIELTRILSNLINNSVEGKSTKRSLKISVSVQNLADQVEIVVADNGKGIPKRIIKQLGKFRFSTRSEGMGLGTYYAFKILKRMKGSIHYSSIDGDGTSVRILLPKYSEVTRTE